MEQLLAHQLRQKDPSMRRKTNEQSAEIAEAGGKLRAALVEEGLQRLFD